MWLYYRYGGWRNARMLEPEAGTPIARVTEP